MPSKLLKLFDFRDCRYLSQNIVREKSFGGTFTFSNCHIIGLDTGSLVLIVFAAGKISFYAALFFVI
jgi:hypothetical protein